MNIIDKIFIAVVISLFIALVVSLKIDMDKNIPIQHDYQSVIEVDKSEKVEWAISNAIHAVTSRNFVLIGIKVTHCTFGHNKFVIKAQGCEQATILKLGD